MDERELAARMLENTAAARRHVYKWENLYTEHKSDEEQQGTDRNTAAAKGAALVGATAVVAERFDVPLAFQLPAYALASMQFVEAAMCQYFKRQYRVIASDTAKDAYQFNKQDFVGLPTPEWIKNDPAYNSFKET